jgi:hypothetical protein
MWCKHVKCIGTYLGTCGNAFLFCLLFRNTDQIYLTRHPVSETPSTLTDRLKSC